jgi:hypothetical protein
MLRGRPDAGQSGSPPGPRPLDAYPPTPNPFEDEDDDENSGSTELAEVLPDEALGSVRGSYVEERSRENEGATPTPAENEKSVQRSRTYRSRPIQAQSSGHIAV